MTNPATERTPRENIEAVAAELGLTMESRFVPWSQSRNKDEKQPSLNWVVTLKRNGREVLSTDYMAGSGHCPAYKGSVKAFGGQNSLMRTGAINWECENGKQAHAFDNASSSHGYTVRALAGAKPIEPDICDVLHSLAMDSGVLDESSFEDWAGSLGYDTDSRKAESIYRACLDIALKLRNGLGEEGLAKLREATQDY